MFKKIFSKQIVVPFFSGIGTVAIFQWIVFPGLTAADTILNIFAGIIGFFTLVYAYYLIGLDVIFSKLSEVEDTKVSEEEVEQPVKKKSKTKKVN